MSRRLYEVAKECGRQPDELFDACRAHFIHLDRHRPQYTILTDSQVDRVLEALESRDEISVGTGPNAAWRLRLERRRLRAEQQNETRSTVFLRAMIRVIEGEPLEQDERHLSDGLLTLAQPGPHPLVKPPRIRPRMPPRIVSVAVVSAAPDLKLLGELSAQARHTEIEAIQLDRNDPENWLPTLRRAPLARFRGLIVVERLLGQNATGLVREHVRPGCTVVGIDRFAADLILEAIAVVRRASDANGLREVRP